MKKLLSIFISTALIVSGYAQTRNVLVGTNNSVVQPTNFWSADASNARTGLGLGTAATNPASAFQPASLALSNLTSSNAVNLTNLQATNLVGVIPSSNIPSTTLTNIGGTLGITSGGTGATNASNARVNLGATTVGNNLFTATNAESARTVIGALATNGDATNLTNFPALLIRTNGSAAGLTNFPTVALASNVTGTIAISNGGTGATNAGGARTNLELGATNNVTFGSVTTDFLNYGTNYIISLANQELYADGVSIIAWNTNLVEINAPISFLSSNVISATRTNLGLGATWLTNVVASNFRTAIGLGVTNDVQFARVFVNGVFEAASNRFEIFQPILITDRDSTNDVFQFEIGADRATARTNLGLGWSALTNTNAGIGFVSVNTNGEVVSPTNFWQVSPANTRVQLIQPVINATNTATNARNLYFYSLAISTTGVTNTIQLPTNGGTLLGDVATVIHEGPTSSITAVRQIGSGTNIITLNQFQEAVKFIYESGGWRLADNISQVEPIYFSGTNAVANAAASRTNLGLGNTNNVEFNELRLGGSDQMRIRGAAGSISFYNGIESENVLLIPADTDPVEINSQWNNANVRSNLGLGLSSLTNTSNTKFQEAIFTTNAAPTNAANFGNHAAWMGVNIVTNGVTNTFLIPLYK